MKAAWAGGLQKDVARSTPWRLESKGVSWTGHTWAGSDPSQSERGYLRKCFPGLSLSLSRLSHPVPALPSLANRGAEAPAPRLPGQPPWPGPGIAGLGHGERVLSGLHHYAPALSGTKPWVSERGVVGDGRAAEGRRLVGAPGRKLPGLWLARHSPPRAPWLCRVRGPVPPLLSSGAPTPPQLFPGNGVPASMESPGRAGVLPEHGLSILPHPPRLNPRTF